MKLPDIDIDVKDRTRALEGHDCVPASLHESGELRRHNTGVYFQGMPRDPVTGLASLPSDRKTGDIAGQLGFYKVDVLPNHAYRLVESPEHRDALLATEPDWNLFKREDVVKRLYQLGNWFDVCDAYEPRSIEDLACLLALIRPGKKRFMGEPWDVVRREVWKPEPDDEYSFKKSHAVAFAMCIVVQLNSMVEKGEIW